MSRRYLTLLLPVLVVVACAHDPSGLYELQTIDDRPLPVDRFPFDGLTALDLQLNGDGTCRATAHMDDSDAPDVNDDCSWTGEGTTITLVVDGDTVAATSADGMLTFMDDDGTVFVFTRRSGAGF